MDAPLPAWAQVIIAFFSIVVGPAIAAWAGKRAAAAHRAVKQNTELTERVGEFIADEIASIANGREPYPGEHDPPKRAPL